MTRLFGDIDCDSLRSGWSEPEDGHVWNNGPEAAQQITLPRSALPLALSLEALPFIGGTCLRQEVTLYVNGIRVKFWRLQTGEIHQLEATIPPHALIERGEATKLNCLWHLPCSTSPQDAGAGGDARQLGLCFRSLMISQINVIDFSQAISAPAWGA